MYVLFLRPPADALYDNVSGALLLVTEAPHFSRRYVP
jgi:hypothetical protein